jgi:hypothetical protein
MSIGASDEKGRVKIRGLATGRYFLRAKYHGIETETRWIKVTNTPKKRNVRFELHWADYSIDTQEVSGMLTGLVTGNTGNKIMDLAHPREVVHPGVALSLKGAFAKDDYNVISDSSGSFVFGSVPPGTYLLTIAGGQAAFGGLIAEETIIVLDVSPSSRRKYLPLQLRQGGCGGIGYELKSD